MFFKLSGFVAFFLTFCFKMTTDLWKVVKKIYERSQTPFVWGGGQLNITPLRLFVKIKKIK